MLIDINLLPKKEPKNIGHFLMIFFLLLLSIVGSAFSYAHYKNIEGDIRESQAKLEETRGKRIEVEEKLSATIGSETYKELEKMVEWAEKYRIESVPLLKKLTALLPERGYVTEFEYDAIDATVYVTVRFDTTREAAFYLKALTEAEFVADATLLYVETMPLEEEEAETVKGTLPRYHAAYKVTLNRENLPTEE